MAATTGALKWDQVGSRSFELGVSNGVLYKKQEVTVDSDTVTKWLGVPWNGLTGVTESPAGAEISDLYADNIKYASLRSAETFGGTIEAYTYPPEFESCDGSAEAAPGVTIGQQSREPFCLVYTTKVGNDEDGDDTDDVKIHIIYNATASPSEKAYQTVNESPEAITLSWEINTTPINVTGHKPVSTITIDSRKVNAAKLTALKDKLYGKDATTGESPTEATYPELPEPDALIAMMTTT